MIHDSNTTYLRSVPSGNSDRKTLSAPLRLAAQFFLSEVSASLRLDTADFVSACTHVNSRLLHVNIKLKHHDITYSLLPLPIFWLP